MGTWGSKLFQDDTAMDVRDTWLLRYKELTDAVAAAAATREECADEFRDSDTSAVAKLAMAVVMWRHGVLDERTCNDAIQAVNDREGLAVWAESGRGPWEDRIEYYELVCKDLLKPMPPVKQYKHRPAKAHDDSGFRAGDVLAVKLAGSGLGYLRVVGQICEKSDRQPIVRLLDIDPEKRVSLQELKDAQSIGFRNGRSNHRFDALSVCEWKPKHSKLFVVVANTHISESQRAEPQSERWYTTASWSSLPSCIRPSLDKTKWTEYEEFESIYKGMSIDNIIKQRNHIMHEYKSKDYNRFEVCVAPNRLMRYSGDFSRAEAVLEVAIELFPADPFVHAYLGRAKYHLQKIAESKAAFENAKRLAKSKADRTQVDLYIADSLRPWERPPEENVNRRH